MLKIDREKLILLINSSFISNLEQLTEFNDDVLITAICELTNIDSLINHQSLFNQKQFEIKLKNIFSEIISDVSLSAQISNHLCQLFLCKLFEKNIIQTKIEEPSYKISIDDIFSTIIPNNIKIDFQHDIPYLAGYSKDGQTIYIDKIVHLPKDHIDIHALILHEYTEKHLFQFFNIRDNIYFKAHQIALRVEKLFVISKKNEEYWQTYQYVTMKNFIELAANKTSFHLPQHFDITPYKDCGYEDFYFLKNDSLLITLTLPVFIKNFEENYNKDRVDEIKEYFGFLNNDYKICTGSFFGFNDFISKSKTNQFGYLSTDSYYIKEINGLLFSIKETFIYYGYGIGFVEIALNSLENIESSQI
ncbi:MAG: hypothetical protein JXK05_00605 [Campylobacterales bacterium]|nr:hypothetical protein [Campylobacterales bacterium]